MAIIPLPELKLVELSQKSLKWPLGHFQEFFFFFDNSTSSFYSEEKVLQKSIFTHTLTTGIYSILFYPITLGGRRGTTDEFATIPFHLDLFSAALVELAKSIPVHSLILSSHLFFCLPLFLFPFTVPCRIVFATGIALSYFCYLFPGT